MVYEIFIILIITIVWCLLCNNRRARVDVLSTRNTHNLKTVPMQWNWTDLSDEDVALWNAYYDKNLHKTIVSSRPINQHKHKYCGCCFISAPIQVLQDSFNIKLASRNDIQTEDCRFHEFDLQTAVNDFTVLHKPTMKEIEGLGIRLSSSNFKWNSCMGGEPQDFLVAIQKGELKLSLVEDGLKTWKSLACPLENAQQHSNFTIRGINLLDHTNMQDLQAHVFEQPVIVGIRHDEILSLDENGILQCVGDTKDRDHVVSVVGWKTLDSKMYWIMRNTWGDHEPIYKRPDRLRECMVECGDVVPAFCHDDIIDLTKYSDLFLVNADMNVNCAGIYDEPSGWIAIDTLVF